MGLLFLLVDHMVAPLVDAAPGLRRAIGSRGSIYRTGDGLPAALMAAGTVLLGLALVRLRRRSA